MSTDEQSGDVDERYRAAASLDTSLPSEAVRRSVLAHAAKLAVERQVGDNVKRTTAARPRWRPAIFGALAAAGLAGLLILPRFPQTPAPVSSANARREVLGPSVPAAATAVPPSAAPATAADKRAAAAPPSAKAERESMSRSASSDAAVGMGRSALLLAIRRGELDAVKELLASGADANGADADGVKPLQAALAAHRTDIADVLRGAGAK
jgi:Ankyrin repeats (many copies)